MRLLLFYAATGCEEVSVINKRIHVCDQLGWMPEDVKKFLFISTKFSRLIIRFESIQVFCSLNLEISLLPVAGPGKQGRVNQRWLTSFLFGFLTCLQEKSRLWT